MAAVIIEEDCVLFAQNENKVDDYYYSVGGGVHLGEKTDDAILREVYEETDIFKDKLQTYMQVMNGMMK